MGDKTEGLMKTESRAYVYWWLKMQLDYGGKVRSQMVFYYHFYLGEWRSCRLQGGTVGSNHTLNSSWRVGGRGEPAET